MKDLDVISPLLDKIARVCGIELHIHRDSRAEFSSPSLFPEVGGVERQALISRFSKSSKPFHQELSPHGPALFGVPALNDKGARSWLMAAVPKANGNGIEKDVMPLLSALKETMDTWQASRIEVDEMALALDNSFEELALYRRIHKSIQTGTLSSSEMHDILGRLRDILHADLVFGDFPKTPDLDTRAIDPEIGRQMDIEAFTAALTESLRSMDANIEGNHVVINNSLGDPRLAPLSKRPFRLMAARAVHQKNTFGWIVVISFDYYKIFNRSHLNMVQTAANQAAIVGANIHLLQGLEGLNTQVNIFKKELSRQSKAGPQAPDKADNRMGDFLVTAFNNLSSSIAATRSLMMRSTQMANMGELAAVFAHEIKQPITALDGFIQIAKLKAGHEEDQDLKMMAKSVRRIITIVRRFESFSRPNENRRQPVSLNLIAREVYYLVTPQLELKQINGRFERDADLPGIIGDAQSLQQAVLNIVSNAIGAMESNNGRGSELVITTYRKDRFACLDVIDNGHGIPEHIIDKVTTPYFTTKTTDKGTGLGLSVVSDIVEQHNGRLELDSAPGKGCRCTLMIPLIDSSREI